LKEFFFDIHTHKAKENAVVNLMPIDVQNIDWQNTNLQFSIGIHPLFIENADEQLKIVSQCLSHSQVKFIGEIGLDKRFENLNEQQNVFERQMQLAEDFKKPVIVHCVRAINEVLAIAKNFPSVKLIFHGFRGKPQLAKQILNAGYFLSFGEKSLLSADTISFVPQNKIFVETDESEISIEEIYRKIAEIKGISVHELCDAVKENIVKFA